MIEIGRLPYRRGVTVAAQTGEVIDRLVLGMAIGTGREAGVIEVGGLPRLGGVARAALAGEVIDGRINLMALLARRRILMIELSRLEGHIGVAALASQAQRLKLALVLIFMAADARCRQALGLPANVTLITVDLCMPAGKRGSMLGCQIGRQRDRTRSDLNSTR